jgi:hypothetical protein
MTDCTAAKQGPGRLGMRVDGEGREAIFQEETA